MGFFSSVSLQERPRGVKKNALFKGFARRRATMTPVGVLRPLWKPLGDRATGRGSNRRRLKARSTGGCSL